MYEQSDTNRLLDKILNYLDQAGLDAHDRQAAGKRLNRMGYDKLAAEYPQLVD